MEENRQTVPQESAAEETLSAQTASGESVPQEPVQEEAPARKKTDWKKELKEWVISIAAALMIVFFIRGYLFEIIRVDGSSMHETLEDGERLFVSVFDAKFREIERNDIIICHYPNRGSTDFVKRCVAVPGDTVFRRGRVTYVRYGDSDFAVALDPMNSTSFYYSGEDYDYTLGEDEYFAVGDNRANSHDSRDWRDSTPDDDVGPITKDMIVGKVQKIVWPLSRFGNASETDSTWNNFYNVELPRAIEEQASKAEQAQ